MPPLRVHRAARPFQRARCGPLRYCKAMSTSTDWLSVRERIASILYSHQPLADRYEALCRELESVRNGYSLFAVRLELESMARSAEDKREAPFLDVGKNLLIYCDQELYREAEARGEDPRWITDLRRREQELADEQRQRELEEDAL